MTTYASIGSLGVNTIECTATSNNGKKSTVTNNIIINGTFSPNNLNNSGSSSKSSSFLTLTNGGSQLGPYVQANSGCYKVSYEGENLYASTQGYRAYNYPIYNYTFNAIEWRNASVLYYIKISQNTSWNYGLETILENFSNKTIRITKLDIIYYGQSSSCDTIQNIHYLELNTTDSNLNNDHYYLLPSGDTYASNFTLEFYAKPTTTTPITTVGTFASTASSSTHNYLLSDCIGNSNSAGIGLAIGTNGVTAIAHAGGYYYTLLSYSHPDLSGLHGYWFVVKNNIPYLYIDGSLQATGIAPPSPVTTIYTCGTIGTGVYGYYRGYANNFKLLPYANH